MQDPVGFERTHELCMRRWGSQVLSHAATCMLRYWHAYSQRMQQIALLQKRCDPLAIVQRLASFASVTVPPYMYTSAQRNK